MADYHRFVSYIYLYERGIKAMNTGFAKVESRDGQCRVNITMKNMYHESHVKFSVYMFVRDMGKLLGIYMGDLNTQNSTGELFCITDSGNIENSGYCLDDVKGMIIRGENGKIYGTGWDDEALDVERFVPLKEANIRWWGVPGEKEAERESLQLVLGDDAQEGTEEVQEASGEADTERIREAECGQNEGTGEGEEETIPGTFTQLTANAVGAALSQAMTEDILPQDMQKTREVSGESDGRDALERVIEQGMRMYPFEDDQMMACVRMEPQDIGMLPMQYWRLAGNSFLLHGYYSYRHLIMAQKKDGTYIFGIPGVNYERERFMAHMFGFDKFKAVRAQTEGTGEFGYWYTELA